MTSTRTPSWMTCCWSLASSRLYHWSWGSSAKAFAGWDCHVEVFHLWVSQGTTVHLSFLMVIAQSHLLLWETSCVLALWYWSWLRYVDQYHSSWRTPWRAQWTVGHLYTTSWLCLNWVHTEPNGYWPQQFKMLFSKSFCLFVFFVLMAHEKICSTTSVLVVCWSCC